MPFSLGDFQSYNEIYGVTRSPWDLGRTPGGSAAALAAGRPHGTAAGWWTRRADGWEGRSANTRFVRLIFLSGNLSTKEQDYDPTSIINEVRQHVGACR